MKHPPRRSPHLDLLVFTYLRLHPARALRDALIEGVFLGGSIISFSRDLWAKPELGLLFALASIAWPLWKGYSILFADPSESLEPHLSFESGLPGIQPAPVLLESGYRIEVPLGSTEAVLRSPTVDRILRNTEIRAIRNSGKLKRLSAFLRREQPQLEPMLRAKFWSSRKQRRENRQDFHNAAKTCLATDLYADGRLVQTFREEYFAAFLLNECCVLRLTSGGPRPRVIETGARISEAVRVLVGGKISPIDDTDAVNNIGMSTLAHTRDNKFVIWRQTMRAQFAHLEPVPTGSGSCDWHDARGKRSLQEILVHGMERELVEESHDRGVGGLGAGDILETRVLGYYRVLRRAGKPEFVGVSKVATNSWELEPDGEEVHKPEFILDWSAASIDEVRSLVRDRLKDTTLSLPLRMTLVVLGETIEDPAGRGQVQALLRIP